MGKTEIEILSECASFGHAVVVKSEVRRMKALDTLVGLRLVHEVATTGSHAGMIVMVKFGAKPIIIGGN